MSKLSLPRQVELGPRSLQQLSNYIFSSGAQRPLVIMDSFLADEPLSLNEHIQNILEEDSIEFELFTEFSGEPTTKHVENALNKLKSFKADSVIAIGGGSAIDISKGVALFGRTPNIEWSEISEKDILKRLPLIAIPTTSGTGSEATGIMVISDTELGYKLNPGHPHLIPDIAILDPDLLISLPKHFTAFTGLDALTHAIEAYVSTNSHSLSDAYAMKAISLIGQSLPIVYEEGNNITERENMLLASFYAGTAFFNSSTNLAHAIGRALGNRFHIPHGLSVAVLLPYVMQYGLYSAPDRYRDIALALGADKAESDTALSQHSIQMVGHYNEIFGIWDSLTKYVNNVSDLETSIPSIVEDALSGNGIKTNRKIPNNDDITSILQEVIQKLKETKLKLSI